MNAAIMAAETTMSTMVLTIIAFLPIFFGQIRDLVAEIDHGAYHYNADHTER